MKPQLVATITMFYYTLWYFFQVIDSCMVEGAAYVGSWLYASKYVYRGQIKLLNQLDPLNICFITSPLSLYFYRQIFSS